ncbi:MAG: helix-turn-helix domain-containing protein, partial [Burkholderiaceae bacterium]|nr:helix-turn-helix domain-containing protein [Burkholderiaceae bacterium]
IAPLRVGVLDAARVIGISRASLYKKILAGEIVVQKDGRRTLVAVDELRRYVARSAA